MKWNIHLVPNYSCLQNPWLGGLPSPDPRSLCPLSSTEFVEPPPSPRTKFLGTPLLGIANRVSTWCWTPKYNCHKLTICIICQSSALTSRTLVHACDSKHFCVEPLSETAWWHRKSRALRSMDKAHARQIYCILHHSPQQNGGGSAGDGGSCPVWTYS